MKTPRSASGTLVRPETDAGEGSRRERRALGGERAAYMRNFNPSAFSIEPMVSCGDYGPDDLADFENAREVFAMNLAILRRVVEVMKGIVFSADFSPDTVSLLRDIVPALLQTGVVPTLVSPDGNPFGDSFSGSGFDIIKTKIRSLFETFSDLLISESPPDFLDILEIPIPHGTLRLTQTGAARGRFIRPTSPEVILEAAETDDLGFHIDEERQASHMSTMRFQNGAWGRHHTGPCTEMTMHPNMQAIHYGSALFEGVNVERGEDGEVYFFRLRDHFDRMNCSARALGLPVIDFATFEQMMFECVYANEAYIPPRGMGRLYLRPNVYDSKEHLKVGNSGEATCTITAIPVGTTKGAYYKIGAANPRPNRFCLTLNRARTPEGNKGLAKAAGNYAFLEELALIKSAGYTAPIYTNPDGSEVRESQASAIAFVRYARDENGEIIRDANGQIPTTGHTLFFLDTGTGDILESVTVRTFQEVAGDMGLHQKTGHISVDTLSNFDECLALGTAAGVTPVHEIVPVRFGADGEEPQPADDREAQRYYSEGTEDFQLGPVGKQLLNKICDLKGGSDRTEKAAEYRERYLTKLPPLEEVLRRTI